MKILLILALTMASSFVFSQSNALNEIEERIENLRRNPRIENISKDIELRTDKTLIKERKLLQEILGGYDLLKRYAVTYRYEYMHKGLQAASSDHDKRSLKLTSWIETVNKELLSRNLNVKFGNEWKTHYSLIKSAIQEANSFVVTVPFSKSVVLNYEDEIQFLESIKYQIPQITKTPELNETISNPTAVITIWDQNLIAAGVTITTLLLMAALFFTRKKEKVSTSRTQNSHQMVVPPLPALTVAESHFEEFHTVTPEVSNLETSYVNCLKRNEHLLRQAELKVLNGVKSPFKSVISVPQERLDQALNFLLQGTLAVANTSSKKASHLEWSCVSQEGRYSLNLTLHGINCDERSLLLNTIIDADFSGPAYFGRAEQTLEEHQPTILFKSNNLKTTISLSLDDSVTSRFQSH